MNGATIGHGWKLNRGHKSCSRLDTTKTCLAKTTSSTLSWSPVALSFDKLVEPGMEGGSRSCHQSVTPSSFHSLSLPSPVKTINDDAESNDVDIPHPCNSWAGRFAMILMVIAAWGVKAREEEGQPWCLLAHNQNPHHTLARNVVHTFTCTLPTVAHNQNLHHILAHNVADTFTYITRSCQNPRPTPSSCPQTIHLPTTPTMHVPVVAHNQYQYAWPRKHTAAHNQNHAHLFTNLFSNSCPIFTRTISRHANLGKVHSKIVH